MQLISLFQYLLTVAETHDSSQQPTDFIILPPFIAMWKLYGIVLNEAAHSQSCLLISSVICKHLFFHLKCKDIANRMQNFHACTKKLCRDIAYLI